MIRTSLLAILSLIACGGAKPLDERTAIKLAIGAKTSENFAQFGAELKSNAMEDTWSGRVRVLSIESASHSTTTLLAFDNVELHAGVDRWGHVSALIRPGEHTSKAIEARDAMEKMGRQLAAAGWHNVVPLGDYWRQLLDNDCKGDHRLTHDWHMSAPGTVAQASMRMGLECTSGISSPSRWKIMLTFESALGE